MVRSISWTDGFFKFGSKAPTLGAVPKGCAGSPVEAIAAEGVVTGAGIAVGKPLEIRLLVPAGPTQPALVTPVPTLVLQSRMNPGTLPAIDVTWNVEIVSKSQP